LTGHCGPNCNRLGIVSTISLGLIFAVTIYLSIHRLYTLVLPQFLHRISLQRLRIMLLPRRTVTGLNASSTLYTVSSHATRII
ncbi:MAG TPA: hypothetical protein VH796_09075, partial [Nitrososphaeraceae archaeon]